MKTVDKMSEILDEERKALLDGNYRSLETLVKDKVSLLKRIHHEKKVLPRDSLEMLQRKTQRNASLLQSAQRGLRSAMSHLQEASESSFQAYSKEGSRIPLSKTQNPRGKL